MTKQDYRVSVDSGKYTFVIPADDYRVSILRYGEPWHGPQGEASNALHAVMCELDAARVVVQAVRQALEVRPGIGGTIADALALHDRLTSDREPPSAWCGVEPHVADETNLVDAMDTASTIDGLCAMWDRIVMSGAKDARLEAARRRYEANWYRIAGLGPGQPKVDQPLPGWIPPSQRVPEPGPCTPKAHNWVSGSAVCQCGEKTRDGDFAGWKTASRLASNQIHEAVTGQSKPVRHCAACGKPNCSPMEHAGWDPTQDY